MSERSADARYTSMPNDLEPYWMGFTANRQFMKKPRLLVAAEGMHYTSVDGRKIIDGTAGLWCVNAGHARKEITEAVAAQIGRMEYSPAFQMGHPAAFELAMDTAQARLQRSAAQAQPQVLEADLQQLGVGEFGPVVRGAHQPAGARAASSFHSRM